MSKICVCDCAYEESSSFAEHVSLHVTVVCQINSNIRSGQ